MLKLYVETIHRLGRTTRFFSERIENRDDESGFAAAENIALAVAGVLIVGAVFAIFQKQITGDDGLMGKLTDSLDSITP